MNIHITSDTHLDFWIDPKHPVKKQERMITELIELTIPEESADIILIAGDIGHYNWQNEIYFKQLRKHYSHVLWVFGNHDLYMVSRKIKKKFKNDSWARLADMIAISNTIDGVHYLEGNIVEIDGIKFGGHGMWYDGSYAKKHFYLNHIGQNKEWQIYSNDSNLINDPSTASGLIDWLKLSNEAVEAVRDIVAECDVFMSHIGPDDSNVPSKWNNAMTGFYYFDGDELLSQMNEKQAWIYGHTHDPTFFRNVHGCTMICNPLGYPLSRHGLVEASYRKFLVFEVGSTTDYEDIFKGIDEDE